MYVCHSVVALVQAKKRWTSRLEQIGIWELSWDPMGERGRGASVFEGNGYVVGHGI